jgi:hypothetical protein
MKKLLYSIPAAAALIATGTMLSPQPAYALPTCEQEVMIRCSGYDVQGRPRLDIYYDSYEECVETETAARCPADYGLRSLDGRPEDALGGSAKANA